MSSRPQRWQDAITKVRDAVDEIAALKDTIKEGLEELDGLKEEYQEWLDSLPDGLQSSPVAEKLQAITELDFEWDTEDDLADAESKVDDAENADLPRGFGRD